MNYITMARKVRSLTGLQGTGPASIAGATGPEAVLVSNVADAWTDLQLYRDKWRWMRREASFQITQGTSEYSLEDIFGPGYLHRIWLPRTAFIQPIGGKWSPLVPYEYDYFDRLYKNDTTERTPAIFAVKFDDSLIFELPNATYNVHIDYQKANQELVTDSDVPELASEFHNLIVYAGIQKYSAYISNPSIYDKYMQEHAILLRSLLRDQLPKEVVRVRGIA